MKERKGSAQKKESPKVKKVKKNGYICKRADIYKKADTVMRENRDLSYENYAKGVAECEAIDKRMIVAILDYYKIDLLRYTEDKARVDCLFTKDTKTWVAEIKYRYGYDPQSRPYTKENYYIAKEGIIYEEKKHNALMREYKLADSVPLFFVIYHDLEVEVWNIKELVEKGLITDESFKEEWARLYGLRDKEWGWVSMTHLKVEWGKIIGRLTETEDGYAFEKYSKNNLQK